MDLRGVEVKLRNPLLALVAVSSVVVILFGQLPNSTLLWRELQNTGHTALFAIMALTSMGILRDILPRTRNKPLAVYAIALVALSILAILTEVGQLITARNPSLVDMLRDAAGILIGLGLYALADSCLMARGKQGTNVFKPGMLALIVCLLGASLYPLLNLAAAYALRNKAFPVIVDLEARWARSFLQFNNAELNRVAASGSAAAVDNDAGRHLARVRLSPGKYPGISILEPFPDWSGYQVFDLEIYSARAVNMVLRVHDKQHNQAHSDRFNRTLSLGPGRNTFRIPLRDIRRAPEGRQMDMRSLAGIMLFATDIDDTVELYSGRFRLR